VVRELKVRAKSKHIPPDLIVITVEPLNGHPVRELTALDVHTVDVSDAGQGRKASLTLLEKQGVSPEAAAGAAGLLESGAASSGGNMRGAMIVDAATGERLEPDRERGIRVSRFDWSDDAHNLVNAELSRAGLTHFRTREALALATKVAHAPGLVAELCWSDDPDYTAGYVASLETGYVRFPLLKKSGHAKGGRAFFVRRERMNLSAFIDYLQKQPVLITGVGKITMQRA
jgi:6-carboxyhexanoate--CoA ligase